MSKKEADILLIRKYLKGELDAKATYELERRAQDDPFLMDALDGYEMAKGDQQHQLDELSERLQQRVNKKERRIIPWKAISIAASILIVFTVGGLFLFKNHSKDKQTQALLIAPTARGPVPEKDKDTSSTQSKNAAISPEGQLESSKKVLVQSQKSKRRIRHNLVVADELASTDKKAEDTAVKDATPLNEMIVMGYTSKHEKEVTASVAQVQSAAAGKESQIKIRGLATMPSNTLTESIKGQVVDKNDGSPLTGVSVRLVGTNIATTTDANGYFKMNVDSNRSKLLLGFIGYQSLELNALNKDSVKKIELIPYNSSLSEVVVAGYSSPKKADDETVIVNAHPQDGWKSFKKYLKDKAISPDGKSGVVKLSFRVDKNGNISNIKILKGLSDLTDQKAIDLISDGPFWVGNTSKEPEEVKVRIRFAEGDN